MAADSQIVVSCGLLDWCLKGIVIHFMAYLFWVECDTFTLRGYEVRHIGGCVLRVAPMWTLVILRSEIYD